MATRIPPEAFAFYVHLGHDRSYQGVADRFGVTKQAVARLAAKENWTARIDEIEARTREAAERKAIESLEEMNTRHLKTLQVIQRKALEALQRMPLDKAMDAIRALDISITKERLVRGEPSERTEVNVEDAIRKQYSRWMTVHSDDEADDLHHDPEPLQRGADNGHDEGAEATSDR